MADDIKPEVIRVGLLGKQVCVPEDWSDTQVERFAGPSGTSNGWKAAKKGDDALRGDPERVNCDDRPGYVHILLVC